MNDSGSNARESLCRSRLVAGMLYGDRFLIEDAPDGPFAEMGMSAVDAMRLVGLELDHLADDVESALATLENKGPSHAAERDQITMAPGY